MACSVLGEWRCLRSSMRSSGMICHRCCDVRGNRSCALTPMDRTHLRVGSSQSVAQSPLPPTRYPLPNPESRIPNPESRIPNPESAPPATRLRTSDAARMTAPFHPPRCRGRRS
ncbi:hypothetical protein XFF6990_140064 [Xanthomonas citri pv. fuscans]|nr:hypothetical protein XFF6990_140064 [Xanthomonas citri pv. fuscans]